MDIKNKKDLNVNDSQKINERQKVDDINIFDEFDSNKGNDLKKEVNEFKDKQVKDIYYYFFQLSRFLKYINVILLLVVIISFSYINVQNNKEISDSSWLDPFCDLILEDIPNFGNSVYCSSISYVNYKNEEEILKIKNDFFNKILTILPKAYSRENFSNSKQVLFLFDNGKSRLRPTEILEEFDNLKSNYEYSIGSKINCTNIEISSDNNLSAECETFSSDWEKDTIVGFNGDVKEDKISGTSISIASGFLNYIEKESSDFLLLDKQKIFRNEDISENIYTFKTFFKIKLKYSNTNNLYLK